MQLQITSTAQINKNIVAHNNSEFWKTEKQNYMQENIQTVRLAN